MLVRVNTSEPSQPELNFGTSADESGYHSWLRQRQQALAALSQSLGLPLGHRVEVWLKDGVRLRGTLQLQEERLFVDSNRDFQLRLRVDHVPFTPADIESCIRIDSIPTDEENPLRPRSGGLESLTRHPALKT
jgi:hypothetical protein